MLLPRTFADDWFDDFFDFDDFPFFNDREDRKMERKLYGRRAKNLMKTDIKVTLENGYMTISAQKDSPKETKNGRFIRKERFSGACERSFYVGDNLTQEDIQGEFKHGVLKLRIPKKEAAPQVEENKYITIE